MRVLFVHPAARMSIWDVARGYRRALGQLLGDASIKDYYLDRHLAYHARAVPRAVAEDHALMARLASENVLNEALYFRADLVVVMSGLNLHPIPIAMLGRAGIPVAVYLTESPYDDEVQAAWLEETRKTGDDPQILVCTNERSSAARGWSFLPLAYDPLVHYPIAPDPAEACDVLFVGTGWQERQRFLEAVDWSGLTLKICGPKGAWPELTEQSPLWSSFVDGVVDNETIAPRYAAAKVCLNFHRQSPTALSANPRVYEIAACGAFQLCDRRPDVVAQFGESVPTFDSAAQLGDLARYYVAHEHERRRLAAAAHRRVAPDTFDARARTFLQLVADRFGLDVPSVHTEPAAPAAIGAGA